MASDQPAPAAARVLYIGHLPHGFYEDPLRKFFAQFGTVTNLRLSRNKATGASKHHAWLEFQSPEVAAIAAEAMDGYFMFKTRLVCQLVPPSKVHEELFKGGGSKFRPPPRQKLERQRLQKPRTPAELAKQAQRVIKRDQELRKKMAAAGIAYDWPEPGSSSVGSVQDGPSVRDEPCKRRRLQAAAPASPPAQQPLGKAASLDGAGNTPRASVQAAPGVQPEASLAGPAARLSAGVPQRQQAKQRRAGAAQQPAAETETLVAAGTGKRAKRQRAGASEQSAGSLRGLHRQGTDLPAAAVQQEAPGAVPASKPKKVKPAAEQPAPSKAAAAQPAAGAGTPAGRQPRAAKDSKRQAAGTAQPLGASQGAARLASAQRGQTPALAAAMKAPAGQARAKAAQGRKAVR